MTNRDFGCAYIEDARVILVEAKASLEQEHFHRAVRKCQESVEMALKGLPRVAGIEYPKAYRVGRVLSESAVAQVVSVERLREIARIADELTDAREDASMGRRSFEGWNRRDLCGGVGPAVSPLITRGCFRSEHGCSVVCPSTLVLAASISHNK